MIYSYSLIQLFFSHLKRRPIPSIFWIKYLIAFTGSVSCADSWSGHFLTLLSGLKISGCTFTASLMAAAPLAAGAVAEMMAYATPGLAVAVETLDMGRGGDVISPWPLDILSGRVVASPWLLGLTTAVPRARLSGWLDCCSWQGLWGRLSGIRVFGLTCVRQGFKSYSLSSFIIYLDNNVGGRDHTVVDDVLTQISDKNKYKSKNETEIWSHVYRTFVHF